MIHIRAPRTGDQDDWRRMRDVLWPGAEHDADIALFLTHDEPRPPLSCGYSNGENAAFVAEWSGGGLCGFVEASIRPYAQGADPEPVGYIEGWYVDPDARRQGVGRALVAAAEAWAAAKGCRQMASDAYVDNTISIDAHTMLGYREIERLVHFVKDLHQPPSPAKPEDPENSVQAR